MVYFKPLRSAKTKKEINFQRRATEGGGQVDSLIDRDTQGLRKLPRRVRKCKLRHHNPINLTLVSDPFFGLKLIIRR